MLYSTPPSCRNAPNDWLNLSAYSYDTSPLQFIFSPSEIKNENIDPQVHSYCLYPSENEDIIRKNALANSRICASPVPSTYSAYLVPTDVSTPNPVNALHKLITPLSPGLSYKLSPLTSNHRTNLQSPPFDDCYRVSTPWIPGPSNSYISPVVRATFIDSDRTRHFNINEASIDPIKKATSFADRLRATAPSASIPLVPGGAADMVYPNSSVLLSPCKELDILNRTASTNISRHQKIHTPNAADLMPPLSPLTPLPSPSEPTSAFLGPTVRRFARYTTTGINKKSLKRKLTNQDSPCSPPQLKRTRRIFNLSHTSKPQSLQQTHLLYSSSPTSKSLCIPKYKNRSFPLPVEISPDFPMFYRRFPASSFFQHPCSELLCTLFNVRHPGGIYNPPRWPLDLYTPRFVRGKGAAKIGLCPICVEPVERGGENHKLWLAMKFSAYKCYHMQYTHGISASTGLPFSPPLSFRRVERPAAGKKEKNVIQEGKCHKCTRWVAVEGIKDMESKVKEIFWWKHAAACHHGTAIPGEDYEDVYELDDLYFHLLGLSECVSV